MIGKLFTILIVFFPLLSIYVTFIPNLSYADLFLVLILPILILKKVHSKIIHKTSYPVFIFIIYLIISLFIHISTNTGVGVFSTFRYILYLLVLTLSYSLFEYNYALKLINNVTKVISWYIILQFAAFFIFSILLPWKIPGLPLVDAKFDTMPDEFILQFYRPTGLFLEPTHFAQYAIVSVSYIVIMNLNSNSSIKKSILPSIAILFSGSSLGLIALSLIYLYWISKKYISGLKIKNLIIVTIVFSSLIILLSTIEYFRFIVLRVIGTDESLFGAAVGYRFNSIEYFFNGNLNLCDWLIGKGRSSEMQYFTGIFYFLNANGIIGVSIYFIIVLSIFRKSLKFGRFLTILVFILSFGSELIANFGILFYFAFVQGEMYLSSHNIINN